MSNWPKAELKKIAEADDLHISPFREDGVTSERPRGSGRSWSTEVSMCAATTDRTRVGTERRSRRRPDVFASLAWSVKSSLSQLWTKSMIVLTRLTGRSTAAVRTWPP